MEIRTFKDLQDCVVKGVEVLEFMANKLIIIETILKNTLVKETAETELAEPVTAEPAPVKEKVKKARKKKEEEVEDIPCEEETAVSEDEEALPAPVVTHANKKGLDGQGSPKQVKKQMAELAEEEERIDEEAEKAKVKAAKDIASGGKLSADNLRAIAMEIVNTAVKTKESDTKERAAIGAILQKHTGADKITQAVEALNKMSLEKGEKGYNAILQAFKKMLDELKAQGAENSVEEEEV